VRAILLCCILAAAGCARERGEAPDDLLCECFADAAYEVLRAEQNFREKAPCCGKCGGTGKVKSGDGLSMVDCPCDPDCECKQKKVSLQ
jgi:hypothetical protein